MQQDAADALDDLDRAGPVLVCVACGHRITSDRARIEVGGRHRHMCVNPAGIPYDIGCFDLAPGCRPVGPRESHWSWFAGHEWQIEVCENCAAHLGWSFHGDGSFYGLVLARLSSRQDDS